MRLIVHGLKTSNTNNDRVSGYVVPIAYENDDMTITYTGGVSKSMLKKSRLDFDKIEKCE